MKLLNTSVQRKRRGLRIEHLGTDILQNIRLKEDFTIEPPEWWLETEEISIFRDKRGVFQEGIGNKISNVKKDPVENLF